MPAPMLSTSPVYPALYLYPLNDSFFIPKQIALTTYGRRVRLGRKSPSSNAQSSRAPEKKQVNFDSSVVSRQHAEVWQEGNKIFVRHTQSANGTFVNGRRLSPEGQASYPYELKTNDLLELGTDITGYFDTIAHQRIILDANVADIVLLEVFIFRGIRRYQQDERDLVPLPCHYTEKAIDFA